MVLEMERDRGKPEWVSCVYRELLQEKRVCTNGYAIYESALREPPREIINEIKSRKPWLQEFGQLTNPHICENCRYNDLRQKFTLQ